MRFDKIKAIFASKKSRIVKIIQKYPSMNMEVDANIYFIQLSNRVTKIEVTELLKELWSGQFEISFHDSIHPPVSDPGAYFSYSTTKTIGTDDYSMTYGNHGWSGGIYHIRIETVSQQIYNLVRKEKLNKIQVTGVGFLSHYDIKSKKESDIKNDEIWFMHQ